MAASRLGADATTIAAATLAATAIAAATLAAATLAAAALAAAALGVGRRGGNGDAIIGEVGVQRHECRNQCDRAAAQDQVCQSPLACFPKHVILLSVDQVNARRNPGVQGKYKRNTGIN
jgi:hypothetical protein